MLEQCQGVDLETAQKIQREFVARRKAEGDQRLIERRAEQARVRAHHGRRARELAETLIDRYNDNHRHPAWCVVTTLLGQYLTVADGSSRYEVTGGVLHSAEGMSEYWPRYAPKPWAALHCFFQAYRAGQAVRLGLWRDMHDRYPSRAPYADPTEDENGTATCPQREIAIGVDEKGRPIMVGRRAKWELYAASYVEERSAGAWLGFMAMKPPDDWDAVRALGSPHWRPEFGHPACLLPERGGDASSLLRSSIYPMVQLPGWDMSPVAEALDRIWKARHRRRILLDEPSFSFDEAIKVLGAVVGISPASEAAARAVFRFCHHRSRAGRLSPAWSLRLCRHEVCTAPLFLYEIPDHKGDAQPPNYCPTCSPQQESHRRKRARRRAKLRQDDLKQSEVDTRSYPSLDLGDPRPE